MVQFKIYNDDKIRRYDKFPSMKDPNILELSLLRIINEYLLNFGYQTIDKFNINDPRIANLFFTYYSSSNFYSWGELPMSYIYNDMVRHIKNQNTSNNFIMTLESIYIDANSTNKTYVSSTDIFTPNSSYIPYEIISAYISENYLNSYNYIMNNNNGVLVVYIPKANGSVLAYIIAVGFDPYRMAKWFCTKKSINDINSLPHTRHMSLQSILNVKLGTGLLSVHSDLDLTIYPEFSESRVRENIGVCNDLVKSLDIFNLNRQSIHDSSIKYGNYVVDENILNIYDQCKPASLFVYEDKKLGTCYLNKFNQYGEYRIDYRLLKHQNDMIRISEIRKDR